MDPAKEGAEWTLGNGCLHRRGRSRVSGCRDCARCVGVSQQNTQRSCLCCTSRSQPTTRILWHHHPIPAQSWRGSQAQSGTQRDCHAPDGTPPRHPDRKSTRLNSSHVAISYAVFCLKKKTNM